MRELTDADVWQIKKFFRRAAVASGFAFVLTTLMVASNFWASLDFGLMVAPFVQ